MVTNGMAMVGFDSATNCDGESARELVERTSLMRQLAYLYKR